jgi:hypothetical protein
MSSESADKYSAVNPLPNIVRTLLINGYVIDSFDNPSSQVWILHVRKIDILGAESQAVLLFADDVSGALAQRIEAEAKRCGAVTISVTIQSTVKNNFASRSYTLPEFFNILGGEVRIDRIFRPDLEAIMNDLGHNRLPHGFVGAADDLLEDYTKDCLQFLLECPVRRYGQERRFEKRPDGLGLGRDGFNLFFDAKAYSDVFHPDADDIRRFASYVEDFNRAYRAYVGSISIFLVVSGSFSSDEKAIIQKSNDLFAMCGTQLAFLEASDLARMVNLVRPVTQVRGAVNWKNVILPGRVVISRLETEIAKIGKDRIVLPS